MKAKTFLIALVVLTLLTSLSYAKIWIVDNNGGSRIADFTTIQAAHDGAADGDTLYVMGSPIMYEILTCEKMLVLIGPGYYLGENLNTQMNNNSATISSISFITGAEGSIIQGLRINTQITVAESNITIKRNHCRIASQNTSGIILSNGASGCLITQNIISGGNSGASGANAIGVTSEQHLSNIIISNNIITGYASVLIQLHETSAIFKNNTILGIGGININNSSIYNCIYIIPKNFGGSFGGYGQSNSIFNCVFSIKISTNNVPSDFPNCIFDENLELSDLFVGITGNSNDGQYQLKEGSPAIGAGLNGADCGAFGGANPYVLSGMPPIPAIYEADIATTGSIDDGLPVKIKVKAHN